MIKLFLSIFLFTTVVNAQHFDWAKSIGGITEDNVEDLTVDNFGNLYITGSFSGTVDFDPGLGVYNLTSNGLEDIFVVKLDEGGEFVWAKSFGGSAFDIGKSICIDDVGNIYVAGLFQYNIALQNGNLYSGIYYDNNGILCFYTNIFIFKIDVNGVLTNYYQTNQNLGNGSVDPLEVSSIIYNGNIIITGNFSGYLNVSGQSLSSNNYRDLFIFCFDVNLNNIWVQDSYSLGGDVTAESLSYDNVGNTYIIGTFINLCQFSNSPQIITFSNGASDIYFCKLDSNGSFLWAKSMGGISSDLGESITTDASGNVYTIGCFQNTIDFDPGVGVYNLTSNGQEDVFISKIDSSGNFIWAKSFGGGSKDVINSIELDGFGNIYTTGSFKNTVDFDPGQGINNISSIWATDAFISKLDSSGNFLWATSMGGGAEDEGVSIKIDNNGSIYTVGTFDGGANFNPFGSYILQTNGSKDIFISKLSQCSNSIINTSPTLSALDTTASYQWLDCVNNYSLISGATSQSYTPTINGIYALEVATNYCVDTSACELVNNVSIVENNLINNLYPNPTNGEFIIEFTNKINGALVIINSLGQTVAEYKIYDKKMQINLNNKLLSGIYFIHIVDVNYRVVNTSKILIN